MREKNQGFTMAELLIVVAIIAVLTAISIPVFISQLEKSREATDLANVRSAYAAVMEQANAGNKSATAEVQLKQTQDDWQGYDTITIGGIKHSKDEGDTDQWVGIPGAEGTCVVSYFEYTDSDGKVVGSAKFTWSGGTPTMPSFSGLTASLVKRWRMRNGVLTYANSDVGDWSVNEEPLAVSKGTTITFNCSNEIWYSYYILDKDGNIVLDSSWVKTANAAKAKYTVPEDGYTVLVTTKQRKLDEATGTYVNMSDDEITEERKQRTLDGITFTLPE